MMPVFWYTITVKKMRNPDVKDLGGFDRDILEWNIPGGGASCLSSEREERV